MLAIELNGSLLFCKATCWLDLMAIRRVCCYNTTNQQLCYKITSFVFSALWSLNTSFRFVLILLSISFWIVTPLQNNLVHIVQSPYPSIDLTICGNEEFSFALIDNIQLLICALVMLKIDGQTKKLLSNAEHSLQTPFKLGTTNNSFFLFVKNVFQVLVLVYK